MRHKIGNFRATRARCVVIGREVSKVQFGVGNRFGSVSPALPLG